MREGIPNPTSDIPGSYRGAKLNGSGKALPDLWRIFHGNSRTIERFATLRNGQSVLSVVNEAEIALKRELASVPAQDWARLCHAAGWTETGAATLSWCEGASADMVWAGFRETGAMPLADAAFLRAARLVKPDFLPKAERLSELLSLSRGDYYPVCVALAARPGTVRQDYSAAQLASGPEFFRAFLASPTIVLVRADVPVSGRPVVEAYPYA